MSTKLVEKNTDFISSKSKILILPRGGYLINTSIGYIQVGAPPETIKDTMMLPKKVPQIFVLPGDLFHLEKGIAVAELEFPIYFNHFLCQKKTLIICTESQKKQILSVLQESVFGPENLDLEQEHIVGKETECFPNIHKEMAFFRGNRKFSDLIVFGIFNEKNEYKIKDITINRNQGENFIIKESNTILAEVPWTLQYHVKYDISERLSKPFQAPEFGITCLGPSHGFDPEDNTSGFLIWLNNRGIMIDPPVNSTEWLRKSNVNPKLIHHVILTHCHADHDAGTFQKILEESNVTIHSTRTILNSFLRKYTALTKIPESELLKLFKFQPIIIYKPCFIEGGKFLFHYSLHSIPALGFRLYYRDQSFYYSSDHLNHPETLETMKQKNVFPANRYKFLCNPPWDVDIIYHESGIPPLHTPISYLASLPEKVQEKITIYHIAQKDFPKDSKLTLARFGIENTLYPKIKPIEHSESIKILDALNHVEIFQDFTISKAREFLMIIQLEKFKKGEYICRKGDKGEKFYIILTGNVSVIETDFQSSSKSSELKKTYSLYDYFGETSLINNRPRTASVVAETDVELITIKQDLFINFIQKTELMSTFYDLKKSRYLGSWQTLLQSKIFANTTAHQKTQIESIMRYRIFKKDVEIIPEGSIVDAVYIIKKGEITQIKNNQIINVYSDYDVIVDVEKIKNNISHDSKFIVTSDEAEIFSIAKNKFITFIEKNPRVHVKFLQE